MIGIDLIKISRMERFIGRYGDAALRRFLSDAEIALVGSPKTAAGFWAAKEACSKALGSGIGGECGFGDMIISKSPKGAPQLSLSPALQQRFGFSKAALSITHDGEYAVAAVLLQP
ncbi:MAG: holo-ACP synthase [Campylobacterales bacterium]|nr:holo-ACP synthase [Campylobacterales bacterium]